MLFERVMSAIGILVLSGCQDAAALIRKLGHGARAGLGKS